jgi:hypothetical protein
MKRNDRFQELKYESFIWGLLGVLISLLVQKLFERRDTSTATSNNFGNTRGSQCFLWNYCQGRDVTSVKNISSALTGSGSWNRFLQRFVPPFRENVET